MKRFACLVLCAALPTLAAVAAENPKNDSPPPTPVKPPTVLSKYDTNGDGKLDETERTAMLADRKKAVEEREKEALKKYDKNGDGKLDDQERAARRDDFLKERRARQTNPANPTAPGTPAVPTPTQKPSPTPPSKTVTK